MSENKRNGEPSAEDFRRLAEERNPPRRVVLPKSGLAVLLRPPNALRVLLQAERLARIGDPVTASAEERSEYVRLLVSVINDALVLPRLSLTPGPNEIDPNWLQQEDAEFLLNWGLGVVPSRSAGEDDLASFPGEPRPDAAAGASGGDLDGATEPAPVAGGSGSLAG